jgi:hypothetical protein
MMSSLPSSSFNQGLLNSMDISKSYSNTKVPQAQQDHQVQGKQVSTASSSHSHSHSHSHSKASQSSRSGPNSIPFPWKLHQILDDASSQNFDTVISWVPSQNGFKVHKPKEFDSDIMPKYFHQTKYKSFQRQLNMWGFERVGIGQQKGSYLHPYFIRGKPDLCREMQRTKIKGIHSKKLRKSMSQSGNNDHSGTGMNSFMSGTSMSSMNSMRSMSSMNAANATSRTSALSRSGSGLSRSSTTQEVAASWQAAAQKVAELERQREEIEKKLNAVSRQQNQMKICDHSGTTGINSMSMSMSMSMSNSMMTPRVSITETMGSSNHSNSSSNSNSNSNSNSQQQQDSNNQVQVQGLQGIINASSLPLEEGDSLFFEGRNFFFVEEGTVKEVGSDATAATATATAIAKKKKLSQRRFSLELKGPDSDQYILKELEEAIQLGSGIFDTTTTSSTATGTTTGTATQYLDTRASYGKVSTSTSTTKIASSYHSQDQKQEQEQEDFLPIPISFPSSSSSITSSSNSNNNAEPTNINGLFLGLDRPGRRFSLLSTPVHNPFETKSNNSNSSYLNSSSPQTKSKSFSTSSSRCNATTNSNNISSNNNTNNTNNILKIMSTRISF